MVICSKFDTTCNIRDVDGNNRSKDKWDEATSFTINIFFWDEYRFPPQRAQIMQTLCACVWKHPGTAFSYA